MKKLLIGFVILLLSVGFSHGQSKDYYTNVQRIKLDGVVYKSDKKDMFNSTIIEDSTNTRTYSTTLIYLNGETRDTYYGMQPRIQLLDRVRMKDIIQEVLAPEMIERLQNESCSLFTQSVVDRNGKIIELAFELPEKDTILRSIPPEQLYEIEQKMKKDLLFRVLSVQQQFQYTPGISIRIVFSNEKKIEIKAH